MTGGKRQPKHNAELAYQEFMAGEKLEGFKSEKLEDGSTRLTGTCPRCVGQTDFEFSGAVTGGGGTGARKVAPEPAQPDDRGLEEATVFCLCGTPHPERPDDAVDNGCGAYWTVMVAL